MAKKLLLVFLALTLCATAAVLADSGDSVETKIKTPGAEIQDMNVARPEDQGAARGRELTDADRLVGQNEKLKLFLDDQKFIIKVMDNTNGFIWSSALPDEEQSELTGTWKRFSSAALSADYINVSGAVNRISAKYLKSQAELSVTEGRIEATLSFDEAFYSVRIIIALLEDGISVEIPDEYIKSKREENKNYLSRIYSMPFFGAVRADSVPGYIFLPDGSGALMRYGESKTYNSSYIARIYGDDLSVNNPARDADSWMVADKKNVNLPVFGMVHGNGQNAFLAVVESGDDYCELEASPAGVKTDYFWAAPRFIYREVYWQSVDTASGFNVTQKNPNKVNAKVNYIFLNSSSANYTGMANTYKELLKSKGGLPEKQTANASIPLFIQAVCAEQSKALFGNKTQVMTRVKDAERWINALEKSGVKNINLALKGFEKGGYSGKRLSSSSIDRGVGTKKDIERLSESLKNKDGRLFLSRDPVKAFEHQISRSSFSYGIDGKFISRTEYSLLFNERYYVNSSVAKRLTAEYTKQSENIAFDSLGNILFSDFKKSDLISRTQAKKSVIETLKSAKESLSGVMLESPNAYALPYSDAAYNIPASNSQYIFETDTVPFLQIVLSGYTDCFSSFLNFSGDPAEDTLRLIDFNTYPAYLLTEQPSDKFSESNMNYVYSSQFDDYKSLISENYKAVNDVLSQVYGKEIIFRSTPQAGLNLSVYSGGKTVAVNYSDKPCHVEGRTVPAKSAVVY